MRSIRLNHLAQSGDSRVRDIGVHPEDYCAVSDRPHIERLIVSFGQSRTTRGKPPITCTTP